MTNTMRYSAAALALLLTATLSPAEVKEPPRAGKVTVEIRYRIRASRDERIRQ